MSVTFQIEALATGRFDFCCYEDGFDAMKTFGPFESREVALEALAKHKVSCVECSMYGCYANPVLDVDVDVNMSNANAAMIMAIAGLGSEDLCGSMDAEEFLGFVMVALAQERDHSAVPSTVDSTPGRATFVSCGLPEGYVDGRLRDLADLATEAMRLGRAVVWG